MNTLDYLERLKRIHHIESDYAAAKLLEVSRHVVSGWRTGRHTFSTRECFKVANLMGINPGLVIADVEAERAEKAGKVEDKVWWETAGKKLGQLAVALGIIGAGISGPMDARASIGAGSSPSTDQDTHCRDPKRRRKAQASPPPPPPQQWCPA
jgi:DNA-binding transcriptional regulator YdaS (Cro superfamily)